MRDNTVHIDRSKEVLLRLIGKRSSGLSDDEESNKEHEAEVYNSDLLARSGEHL